MAFSVANDGFYFGTSDEVIGRYDNESRPTFGGRPVEWSYKTQDNVAAVSAAGYFNAISNILAAGDTIRLVVVSNRGTASEVATNSTIFTVDSVVNGVVTVTDRGANDGGDQATWGNITGTLSAQTDLQSALDAKSGTSHTHTGSQVTVSGTEGNAVVIGSGGILEDGGTTPGGGEGGGGTWGSITGTLSNQTDLQSALDAKAASSHVHDIEDVTGLQDALDAKPDDLSALVSEDANNELTGPITVWLGTQANYDALTPDSETIYLVKVAS